MKNPIFVALDLDDGKKAIEMAQKVQPFVGGFKLGPRICMRYGSQIVKEIAKLGEVFVDNKYYDIPNTMEFAIRATFASGASYATIHSACGPEALERMASVERELCQERPFKILAVTVLTSFSQSHLPPHWEDKPIEFHVNSLAQTASDCGISGFVCSGHEVSELRKKFPEAFLVTPGIRLESGVKADQSRVMVPSQAITAGASALVVGRPIIEAPKPEIMAEKFKKALN